MQKKYLIVEDDDALRELLSVAFCDDADILTANNGQNANKETTNSGVGLD